MEFDAFIAPLDSDRFMAEYYGRQPVHIAAEGGRRPTFDWARFRALLAIRSHWTENNIELILNSRAVGREHYLDQTASAGQLPLADPNKVNAFLAMGASLVANAVEQIDPDVRSLTDMLADRFAGQPSANLYCSFGGIQAFASHYDSHEVFALHCEGEKVWRIYENRADAPLAPLLGGEAAQRMIDGAKGGVMMEVRMSPGDLLYIPRGFFHDALASSSASLHLTLAVMPYSARILFRLLEQTALRERAFREYLPDGRDGDGAELRARLAELAERVSEIMRSPAFQTEVANSQAKLVQPSRPVTAPDRPPLEAFARTERRAEIVRGDAGAVVRIEGRGADLELGRLAEEAEWIVGQPAIVVAQLLARYPHRNETELRALLDALVGAALLVPYQPQV